LSDIKLNVPFLKTLELGKKQTSRWTKAVSSYAIVLHRGPRPAFTKPCSRCSCSGPCFDMPNLLWQKTVSKWIEDFLTQSCSKN